MNLLLFLEANEKLAGWAQAAGGVLAILAAFVVSRIQIKAARAAQDTVAMHHRRGQIEHALALIEHLHAEIERWVIYVRKWPAGVAFNLNGDILQTLFPPLDAALSMQMPAECVTSLLKERTALANLIQLVQMNQGQQITNSSKVEIYLKEITEKSLTGVETLRAHRLTI